MSIKYFCDKCGKELPKPYCLYTMGWILCEVCRPVFEEENRVGNVVVLPPPPTQTGGFQIVVEEE